MILPIIYLGYRDSDKSLELQKVWLKSLDCMRCKVTATFLVGAQGVVDGPEMRQNTVLPIGREKADVYIYYARINGSFHINSAKQLQ